MNYIKQGDCLELMKGIPDGSVDMILCDLPYGNTWASWDKNINLHSLWTEYERICNGAIVLFSCQPFSAKLIQSNPREYKYSWYWVKNIAGNYLNVKRQPLRCIEEICVFNKHHYYPQGTINCSLHSKRGSYAKTTMQNYKNEWEQTTTNYPKNVLFYKLDKKKYHPTQKPVALLEYLIKTYTNEGETVLDNCMGSGSTGVACVNTGRDFIGFELEAKYFEIAKQRIEEAELQKAGDL